MEPPRRRALLEALREAAKTLGEITRSVEEVREEIVGAVEEASGIPLRPETRMLMGLYDLTPPPQPSLRELRLMVAKSLGLDDPERLEEWLRKGLGAGGDSPEPGGRGAGEKDSGEGKEDGR